MHDVRTIDELRMSQLFRLRHHSVRSGDDEFDDVDAVRHNALTVAFAPALEEGKMFGGIGVVVPIAGIEYR